MKHEHFSTRPLYLQARDALVAKIAEGVWPPGSSIPNENQLAQQFGISVGTIRKALEEMERERIVSRRQGRGTYVNDQSTGEMAIRLSSIRSSAGLRIEEIISCPLIETGAATPEEMERLALTGPEEVIRVQRVHSCDGHPFMLARYVLPRRRFPVVPTDLGKCQICAIAQSNSLYLGHAEEKVSARLPSESEAIELHIRPDQPILELDRIVFSVEGPPVEWRRACCFLREKYYAATIS